MEKGDVSNNIMCPVCEIHQINRDAKTRVSCTGKTTHRGIDELRDYVTENVLLLKLDPSQLNKLAPN